LELSFEAAEPFPDELFRVPVPDALFEEMSSLSDSALRSVLALIRLSFRFEPEKSAWVKSDRTFSRAEIEEESGLSGQGTRNGLQELEEAGYVAIDRSGRSFQHKLEIDVPDRRYTYLPTALLEEAPSLTGTELRVLLTVLRATWGWTSEDGQEENSLKHRRWAQLSNSDLARRAGRSASAVKEAVQKLQGRYLGRRRPTSRAYYYRFLPEALLPEEPDQSGGKEDPDPKKPAVQRKVESSISVSVPNDLPPDRQRSGPRVLYVESSSERPAKQESQPGAARRSGQEPSTNTGGSAVLEEEKNPEEGDVEAFITGFSEKKRELGQKLANVGVWPRRIPEILRTFSAERIELNFEYFRQEAMRRTIRKPGGWLYAAITRGYRTPSQNGETSGSAGPSSDRNPEPPHPDTGPSVPEPGTKVPEPRKEALIQSGKAKKRDFEKTFPEGGVPQFIYQANPAPSPAAANLSKSRG
jgi:hypothetical protein